MKTPRTLLALAVAWPALMFAGAPATAEINDSFDPSKLTAPPLRRVLPVKPERYVMPNGIVVFLLEDHDLPYVTGSASFKSSPLWIPADKVGLGSLTGQVMRTGGSAAHSGDELDDRLGAIGASVRASISGDEGSGGFRCLTENTAEVIGDLADVLRRPSFPEDKIELAKVGLRQGIASRNDEMVPLLVRVAGQAIYGKDHPLARQPEYATVAAIQRSDCVTLHQKVFVPNRMVLAIYGDFRSADMKKLLATKFGDWKKGDAAAPPEVESPKSTKPRLVFAPKDDVTQSGIIVTHPGYRMDDPDAAAMEVIGMALGGGFQSRLFNLIRTQRGLAYATGSQEGGDYRRPGLFFAYSLTKGESTMVALDLLRQELDRITHAPLSDAELNAAKNSVLNGFVFKFEDPSQVLFRSATFEQLGYPLDFLDGYQQALAAVTTASAFEAAKRKIHPADAAFVVVGKEADFDRPLATAGVPVERADISIPPPPSSANLPVGVADPQARAKGAAWLQKAAEQAGGSAAWKAVKGIRIESQATLSIQGQSLAMGIDKLWELPSRQTSTNKLPMGEMKQGFDGKSGWVAFMGKIDDQPKMAEQVQREWEQSFFHLFGEPGKVEIQALPETRTVEGVTYDAAYVKSDAVHEWVIFFAKDGNIAGMENLGEGQNGPAKVVEWWSDWKPFGALQFPRAYKASLDGKPFVDSKITTLTLNPAIEPNAFTKPTP